MTRAFVMAGTHHQPQRYVIGDGETIDDAQASERWVSVDSGHVAEVRP